MYARSRTRPDAQTPCAVLKRCAETTRNKTEIVDLVKTRIPRRFGFDAVRDIQVLCPMNRGGARARSLKHRAAGRAESGWRAQGRTLRLDLRAGRDKVMHIVNDYGKNVCNKSQGSEYPAVVIPMLTQHYAMLRPNLLYTGVTRGKRLVVLVGQSATPPDAGDGPGWTNGCGTWQGRGAGPATVHRLAGS